MEFHRDDVRGFPLVLERQGINKRELQIRDVDFHRVTIRIERIPVERDDHARVDARLGQGPEEFLDHRVVQVIPDESDGLRGVEGDVELIFPGVAGRGDRFQFLVLVLEDRFRVGGRIVTVFRPDFLDVVTLDVVVLVEGDLVKVPSPLDLVFGPVVEKGAGIDVGVVEGDLACVLGILRFAGRFAREANPEIGGLHVEGVVVFITGHAFPDGVGPGFRERFLVGIKISVQGRVFFDDERERGLLSKRGVEVPADEEGIGFGRILRTG